MTNPNLDSPIQRNQRYGKAVLVLATLVVGWLIATPAPAQVVWQDPSAVPMWQQFVPTYSPPPPPPLAPYLAHREREANMRALTPPSPLAEAQAREQAWFQQEMLQLQRERNQLLYEQSLDPNRPVACGILDEHRYAREGC